LKQKIVIEACVGSVASAIEAAAGGAARVELCDNLSDGGTTPSIGAIAAACRHLEIDVNVMIRPRGGDFLYDELELEIMKEDVLRVRELGINGVVFGILNADGTIDGDHSRQIIELCNGLSTTCHRAFDMTADPHAALETLIELGVDRVLTSGQRPSAMAGIDLLADLVEQAGDRIIVMPGVGIDSDNIEQLVTTTRAREYHVFTRIARASGMQYRNPKVFMGMTPDRSEYEIELTDRAGIRAICDRVIAVSS
jgi:copper homeostasis protein